MGAVSELRIFQREKERGIVMFFKTSVLKRLFKDAYKGAGLTVGHMTDPEDEEVDGYYISSGWWVIWFNNWTFPKEAKAAIIELCGELPQPGEVFKAIDGAGNQYEIEQKEIFNLPAAFERAKVKFRKTNILQQQSDRVVRILQEEEGRTVKAVSELFFNLINRKAIDYDNGEYDPIGPVATSKESPFLYWGEQLLLFNGSSKDDGRRRRESILGTLGEDRDHLARKGGVSVGAHDRRRYKENSKSDRSWRPEAAEQAQGGQTYRLRQKGSGSDKGSKKGIATGRNRSRGPAPRYRQTIHKPVI